MQVKYLEKKQTSIKLFVLLFIVHAAVYMTKNMFSAAMATIVEEGVMTKSQTGAISAGFWLIYAVSQIIGGFAADKYSPSKLIIIGLLGGIASNLIIYLNRSYWVIFTIWCINAAFQFGLWPGIFKIVSTQLAKSVRSKAVLWILFSTSVGMALSMLTASFVSKWQYNFLVSAIVLAVVLMLWVIEYAKTEKQMVVEKEVSEDIKTEEKSMGILQMSLISGFPILVLISLFVATLNNGIKTLTPLMLMESYENLSAAVSTRMSVILIVFSTLGMFVAGVVRDKITKNEIKACILLMAVVIPLLAVLFFVGMIHFFAILAVLSLAVAIFQGISTFTNSYTATRFSVCGRVGFVAGALNAAASVGNIVASYIFPKISESMPWNKVTLIWSAMTALSIILSICMVRVWTSFIKEKV